MVSNLDYYDMSDMDTSVRCDYCGKVIEYAEATHKRLPNSKWCNFCCANCEEYYLIELGGNDG